jgi:CBS domain-containing protein
MTVSPESVESFLRAQHPFLHLSQEALTQLAQSISIVYRSEGDHSDLIDINEPRLYVLRHGAVDLFDRQGELIDRLDPGACFGYALLLTGKLSGNKVLVTEEAILYAIPAKVFHELRSENRAFEQFFHLAYAQRFELNRSEFQQFQIAQKASEIMTTKLVSVSPEDPIYKVAGIMTEAKVSSVLVVKEEKLVGIMTDRDIRTRLVAKKGDIAATVTTIMTENPITIEPNALLHEATFKMLQQNIHHLPVIVGDKPVGMMSAADIIRVRSNDPLTLVNKIAKSDSVAELKQYASRTQKLLYELIRSETTAGNIGQVFTSINDRLTKRLVQLAQQELGLVPAPYCWVAFGSQARFEQHAGSDQDNGLIFLGEPQHQAYFVEFAKFICEALNECGFRYCPGDVMAQNPRWCQPVDVWIKYFQQWLRTPDSKAVMHSSIFFDIRAIAGDPFICQQLKTQILSETKGAGIFLAMLAGNALKNKAPIGFFNQFMVAKGGYHHKQLDLKHQGLTLITDLARIYALANGIETTQTPARIKACLDIGVLTEGDALNLLDAFEFIAQLRFQQQLENLQNQAPVSNYIAPRQLNSLQRNHLKAVFRMVDRAQQALGLKFTRGMV